MVHKQIPIPCIYYSVGLMRAKRMRVAFPVRMASSRVVLNGTCFSGVCVRCSPPGGGGGGSPRLCIGSFSKRGPINP